MNFIDDFFKELDKEINRPLKIILTGAMAGVILGRIRPSMDIDFEVEFSSYKKLSEETIEGIQAAIRLVSKKMKLPAQYSENIQGWSQISFLDYREKSLLYKKIGEIEIRLLSPEHWTIGKMARYLELDKMDIVFVLKKHPIGPARMVSIWGEALKKSIRSDKSREFRDHVLDFLKTEGKNIWKGSFDPSVASAQFKMRAGIS